MFRIPTKWRNEYRENWAGSRIGSWPLLLIVAGALLLLTGAPFLIIVVASAK